jgi:hypothetical protein
MMAQHRPPEEQLQPQMVEPFTPSQVAPLRLHGQVKMAHFAEIDQDGVVLRVFVVSDEYLLDENGQEQEALGRARLVADHGGEWIQCSYNARIRGAYPGIGWVYDRNADEFKRNPVGEDLQQPDNSDADPESDTNA